MYQVLLYYKYVNLENSEFFAEEHLEYCKNLGLLGRILVAPEGINGTCSGRIWQTERYIEHLRKDKRFEDIEFKIDDVDEIPFKKMFVRHKKELVTFRFENNIDPNVITGKHLEPKEFLEMMENDDVVILDGRTNYEYDLGHFRNAIRPEVESFREFPEWIRKNLERYKDKKILTYCTGGIRCEKLSGFMMQEGFKNIYQLHGGIVNYAKDKDTKGRLFDGKCYVFDERISVPVNSTEEDVIISKCVHCGQPCDRYINCIADCCHIQHFQCEECEKEWKGLCSEECRKKILFNETFTNTVNLKEEIFEGE